MIIQFPFRRRYSDAKIIEVLSQGSEEENKVLEFIYEEHYRSVQRLILRKGGQKSDVPDLFQDAVVVFYEKAKAGNFQLKGSIGAFLAVVAQNIWLTGRKRGEKILPEADLEQFVPVNGYRTTPLPFEDERSQLVGQIMAELKSDCRTILYLSIYRKLNMKVIAEIMGYKNEQIARNKKNKCLNSLRRKIGDFPQFKETLREFLEKD